VITTVTPNPSLDRTLHIARLRRGALHRATATRLEPSGKGVNVAVALHAAGVAATAVLPCGGDSGRTLASMLAARGVPHRTVDAPGPVRTNVSVIEDDGTTSKFNEPGPTVTDDDVRRLVAATLDVSAAGQWVAWCGSLPGGFSPDALRNAVAACRAAGRRVAVDTSGPALRNVLQGPAVPHLVKPNLQELAELVGHALPTLGAAVDAATALIDGGVEAVAVSLGGQGAVVVERSGARFGRAAETDVVNTAGAGDAFLAGYLAAADDPTDARLANALRFGAAAVRAAGTLLDVAPAHLRVEVGPPPRDLALEP
jgi:1-phosphofructokinase